MYIFTLILSFIVLMPVHVHAQPVNTIDFSDPLISILGVVSAAIGVLLMYLWQKFSPKYGLDKLIAEEKVAGMLDRVLDEAVDFGASKIKDADWTKVETKNEAVATAMNYAVDHGAELLSKVGLSGDDLIEKLESKMLKHDTSPGVWVDTPDA